MKLIEDLGMRMSDSGKFKTRFGMFKCEVCGGVSEKVMQKGKQANSCSASCHMKSHGMSRTRPYSIWKGIMGRCYNKNNKSFDRYQHRTPPKKWNTFEGFWDDMEEGYADGLTIERKDNTLPYSKGNCKWATYTEQNLNKYHSSGPIGIVGIRFRSGKYEPSLTIKRKGIYLGRFKTIDEAIAVRNKYVSENNTGHRLIKKV